MNEASPPRVSDLPRRYARALFELAQDTDSVAQVATDIRGFVDVFQGNDTLRALARNPFASRDRLSKLLGEISQHLRSSDLFSKMLGVLVHRRRLNIIPSVALAYEELLAQNQHKTIVEITSASQLNERHRERLIKILSDYVGGELQVRSKTNPDLIGGVTVQIGSNLIDASIAARLRRMRDQTLGNLV